MDDGKRITLPSLILTALSIDLLSLLVLVFEDYAI
jgi:hypothetical protein